MQIMGEKLLIIMFQKNIPYHTVSDGTQYRVLASVTSTQELVCFYIYIFWGLYSDNHDEKSKMGLCTGIVQKKSILVENTTFRKGLKGKLGYIRMVTLCPQDEL